MRVGPWAAASCCKVFDAGTRMRRVMGCRVSLAPEAAQELGKICFRHVFESEEEDGRPSGRPWEDGMETAELGKPWNEELRRWSFGSFDGVLMAVS